MLFKLQTVWIIIKIIIIPDVDDFSGTAVSFTVSYFAKII